ncbi:heat shock chaperonin-binding motif containing protein [Fragilaria crotonensis]|nr:heat shock chaperonin-binding motif containing protein [Fragilaria crotonensis]
MAVRVFIRLSNGTKFPLELDTSLSDTTVRQVKALLQEQEHGPIPLQRLIYKGRILDDDRSLSDYAIVHESTLHLVKSRAPVPPSPPATVAASPPPAQQRPTVNRTVHVPAGSNTNVNPFAPANMPPGMMPGMMNPQDMNPEQMSQMMNSPLMQSLFDNPDLMRTMMEMNPQMQQLMDSNPQLREVFNNPQLLRQSLEMMRNPQAMQHMMRSQDLAMSQLENMPGGFSALSNMYRDVQEPMMEAMAPGGSNTTQSSGDGSTNSLAGATGTAMPNPWGSSTSTSRTNPNTSNSATRTTPPSMPNTMMNNPWGFPPPSSSSTALSTPDASNPWAAAPTVTTTNGTDVANVGKPRYGANDGILSSKSCNDAKYHGVQSMMQQMMEHNPQAARMLQDPQVLRSMMQPDNLRAMMQLQQAMGGVGGGMMMPPPPGMMDAFGMPPPTSAGSMPPTAGGLDFSTLLNQMQATNLGVGQQHTQQQQQHPADRFRVQLQSLRDMGFDDEQASLRALLTSHGNLNRAVDMLLMGEVPDHVPGMEPPQASSSASSTAPPSTAPEAEESPPLPEEENTAAVDENKNADPKDKMEKKND